MFEKAARMKLRFYFRGSISVEDLWDLSVQELDSIFKVLNAEARVQQEESLLDMPDPEDEIVALKIGIVRHIVSVKLQEQENREKATERRARKEKLMAILEEKQDAELHGLAMDDLRKLIDELD
jgi:hypothetical protein